MKKTYRPNLDEKIASIDATIERLNEKGAIPDHEFMDFIRGCQDPDVRGVLFGVLIVSYAPLVVDSVYSLEQLKIALLNGEY